MFKNWGREAQQRKRRVDDLLLSDASSSSYKKLATGKYACLVCPNNPILDTPLMLSSSSSSPASVFSNYPLIDAVAAFAIAQFIKFFNSCIPSLYKIHNTRSSPPTMDSPLPPPPLNLANLEALSVLGRSTKGIVFLVRTGGPNGPIATVMTSRITFLMSMCWTFALISSYFDLLLAGPLSALFPSLYPPRWYPRRHITMDPDTDVKRPICIITGTTSGLGAAVARDLAGEGYHVILEPAYPDPAVSPTVEDDEHDCKDIVVQRFSLQEWELVKSLLDRIVASTDASDPISIRKKCHNEAATTSLRQESTGEMETKCVVLLWLYILVLILFRESKGFLATKVVLSSDPMIASCIVLAISNNGSRLIYCRPGDDSWRVLPPVVNRFDTLGDIVYYRGKFYVVCNFRVFVCDIRHDNAQVVEILPRSPLFSDRKDREVLYTNKTSYLVVSHGDLLLVSNTYHYLEDGDPDSYDCEKRCFEVFRVVLELNGWLRLVKMNNVGGCSLFVGSSSISISAGTSPSFRGNCIYFIYEAAILRDAIVVYWMDDGNVCFIPGFSDGTLDTLDFPPLRDTHRSPTFYAALQRLHHLNVLKVFRYLDIKDLQERLLHLSF